MNTTLLLTGMLATVLVATLGFADAYAQYLGNTGNSGETGSRTLEEALRLQHERVVAAQENPASGSGTPYLDASGVLGATVISGAIFGGIAGAFMIRGRSGKYAAQGRG
ncbi:MAG: putative exported protein [Cenarchaeum symbiont of Oopsacas minuta]|nr:putative exported protein [Cenarchaeum symbiont of Oopsacas minuta]